MKSRYLEHGAKDMRIEWYGKILHVITDNEEMMGRVIHQEIDGELKPVPKPLYIELDEPHMPVFGVDGSRRIAISSDADLLDFGVVDKARAALLTKLMEEVAEPLSKLAALAEYINIDFYNHILEVGARGHHIERNWSKEYDQILERLKGRPL